MFVFQWLHNHFSLRRGQWADNLGFVHKKVDGVDVSIATLTYADLQTQLQTEFMQTQRGMGGTGVGVLAGLKGHAS